MQVLMIRHSKTRGNEERRYVGSTDQPLSESGIKLAQEAAAVYAERAGKPDVVYVTPLVRTQMTAKILFPGARQIVVEDLREMDFGVFEGRSADEMKDDPQYKAWLDNMCKDRCPDGEKIDEFSGRVCRAFAEIMHENLERSPEEAAGLVVMVLHGGTIMSICERYALPKRGFYDTFLTNCRGIMFDVIGAEGIQLVNESFIM